MTSTEPSNTAPAPNPPDMTGNTQSNFAERVRDDFNKKSLSAQQSLWRENQDSLAKSRWDYSVGNPMHRNSTAPGL